MDSHQTSMLLSQIRQHLDPQHTTPLYQQLTHRLAELITTHHITHGQVLPAERQFAHALGLSRSTVVKALALLNDQGLLMKQQGKGSVVTYPLTYDLSHGSFSAQLSQHGELSDQWLARELIQADETLAATLGVTENTLLAKIRRVRKVNSIPTSLETTYILASYLPAPHLLEGSLYAHWRQQGISPTSQQYQVSLSHASVAEAGMLEIHPNDPLIEVIQRSYLPTGEQLEYSQSLCRGDYYTFVFSTK